MPFPSMETLGVLLLGPVLILRIVLFNLLNVLSGYEEGNNSISCEAILRSITVRTYSSASTLISSDCALRCNIIICCNCHWNTNMHSIIIPKGKIRISIGQFNHFICILLVFFLRASVLLSVMYPIIHD